MAHDRMEIGWWIKSNDDELYGPISRTAIWNYVQDGVLTPDTLVRHSLALNYEPLGEQAGLEGGHVPERSGQSDRLAEVWPRKQADRRALAEGSFRCLHHNRPATQVCMCCLGAYCEKCRVNRYRPFYYCRKCHAALYNARGVAFIIDSILLRVVMMGAAIGLAGVGRLAGAVAVLLIIGLPIAFFTLRDALFKGAGPGKRMMGLHVVRVENPFLPVSLGQGFIRTVPNYIPLVNLVDLSVPYRDPLWRRWGDRWARTRVLFTESKLQRLRAKASSKMEKNAGEFLPLEGPPQEQLAQLG